MSALLETSFIETKPVPYTVKIIQSSDSAVRVMRSRFFANYGLKEDAPNPNLKWFAVLNDTTCLVIFALGQREDGGVEGTDFYVLPTREGVIAARWTLAMGVKLIDLKIAPYFYVWVLGKNKVMRRRVEAAFGVTEPRTCLYAYPPDVGLK
jgi:hypothetical protein